MTARERCPECGAADEYTGDLCYSCGYGHMECPRCKDQMSQGQCYTCGLTVGTDGPPPAPDITAETPGIIPPALPGRLGPRREGSSVEATMTLPQEQRDWLLYGLPGETIHEFGDGSTIRRHSDPKPVGQFMRNCWQDRPPRDGNGVMGVQYAALHDAHGIPRVAFHIHGPRNHLMWPLGMRNKTPKPEHAEALAGWAAANNMGMVARGTKALSPEDWLEQTRNPGPSRAERLEEVRRQRQANILDPIQETLDPTVFLRPDTPEPVLKPELRHWIQQTIVEALDKHGYDGMENWLSLVLTGSLTTYQYSERSDCDISLFVDTPKFPEWSRAEMIGIMVDACDGQFLPGTTHELQAFVVDTQKLTKDDLYQPGLRSGYDLHTQRWLVPPDKSRVHDVKREQDIDHTYALEVADKMERLIRYEPDKAVRYYKQIHHRRQRDQLSGKGDFAQSNVVYKMLDQRGLFDKLRDLGVKIAKAETPPVTPEPKRPKIFDYEELGPWTEALSPEPHRDVTGDEV